MNIFINKASRYHGENRITLSGVRSLSEYEQIDGTLIFEGTLAANATVRLVDQVGGYWFVKNDTIGGYSIVLSASNGSSVTIPNGAFVCVVFLRGVGIKAIESNAIYFRDQPYASASANDGQSMRYSSGSWSADYPRQTVRSSAASSVSVAASDDVLLLSGSATSDVAVQLPNVSLVGTGRVLSVKDLSGNASAHPITISAYAGQDIDGASTFILDINSSSVQIVSRSGGWSILTSRGV